MDSLDLVLELEGYMLYILLGIVIFLLIKELKRLFSIMWEDDDTDDLDWF
jgi:hypothetical protein